MRYQLDIQVALRERLRRLMVADPSDAAHEIALTADWILRQPLRISLLAEAETAEPGLGASDIDAALRVHEGFRWPSHTEMGRAALIWSLMQTMAAEYRDSGDGLEVILQRSSMLTRESRFADMWRGFPQRIVQPLFDYLTEGVGTESSALYALERYVRRVEWFDREDLYLRAASDTQKTEEIYDADLRRFLFSEGLNMPFSQARSASGLSDVLAQLDSDDPLVCEVKVFDGVSRSKHHLATGVGQVLHYADDYKKQVGYLVIINLSGHPLMLPNESAAPDWPPWITVAGIRIYLIAVRALPTQSASKLGKPGPIVLTLAELADSDAGELAEE